jgi:hypothetical protein
MSVPIERDERQADYWEKFAAAKNAADRTGARADIERAADAWDAWLTDFIPLPSERLAIPQPRFQRGHQ